MFYIQIYLEKDEISNHSLGYLQQIINAPYGGRNIPPLLTPAVDEENRISQSEPKSFKCLFRDEKFIMIPIFSPGISRSKARTFDGALINLNFPSIRAG